MAERTTLQIGGITLTRVLYIDVMIPPEAAGLTIDDVQSVAWRAPEWASDTEFGASASAWIIESEGRRIVLDPLQAADEVLHDPAAGSAHTEAFIELMEREGFPVETIDTVLISHIETVGMMGRRDEAGEWVPLFPNARIVIPRASLVAFERAPGDFPSTAVWRQFIDAGLVDTIDDGEEIVPGMRAELTGAHNPGHTVFHFGSGPEATWLGHLAVSPLHLATGLCPQQHPEPERAWEILQGFRDDGRLLLGPLWPSPGIGRWHNDAFHVGADSAV